MSPITVFKDASAITYADTLKAYVEKQKKNCPQGECHGFKPKGPEPPKCLQPRICLMKFPRKTSYCPSAKYGKCDYLERPVFPLGKYKSYYPWDLLHCTFQSLTYVPPPQASYCPRAPGRAPPGQETGRGCAAPADQELEYHHHAGVPGAPDPGPGQVQETPGEEQESCSCPQETCVQKLEPHHKARPGSRQ